MVEKEANDKEASEKEASERAKQLLVERRLLFLCTALVGLSAVLWLTAVCTDHWFVVHAPDQDIGLYVNETQRYFLKSHSGLFRICRMAKRTQLPNATHIKMCKLHEMFPSEEKLKTDPSLDRTIINYTRTEMFFSIVSLLMMIMGSLFSLYTFRNPRYMFKRLAGGIHFLSCASAVVVIEVVINSIKYEKQHLHFVHPRGADYYYGFSFYLGWIVIGLNLISAVTFMLYSKKRKGDKAPTDEIAMADEPTIIGR